MYKLLEQYGKDTFVARLSQTTETAEQMIPIVSQHGNPDSPFLLVVASFPEVTPLEGEVDVMSWEPVNWFGAEAVLEPNQGPKTIYLVPTPIK